MPLHSDEYLEYLLERAEIELSQKIPCIFYRFSLAVTQGTSTYTLPSGIINIVRVTWKGDQVTPWEHSDTRNSGWMKPQDLNAQGKPVFYLSYQYGFGKIKFHPVPHESVTADDTNIYGSSIGDFVIISAYRIADPDSDEYRIPQALRLRYGKYYCMYKAYQREGKGQDLQAAEYFRKKYEIALNQFRKVIMKIPSAVTVQFGPTGMRGSNKIPRPTLPSSGAWGW